MIDDIPVYCINLSERPDRWSEVQEEVKKVGLKILRYPAIKHSRGHTGCILSHMALWQEAKELGIWMTIEDDVLFLPEARENLEQAYSQLPDDWDMLYLGATLNEPIYKVSPNLLRLKHGWTTHGIIYNNQHGVVDTILELMDMHKVDVVLADLIQPIFNCYMCYPMVATQRPGHSDIVNHYTDYKAIMDRYNKYVKDER